MNNVAKLRRQLIKYGKCLFERDHVGGSEGNISIRLNRNRILITPTGKCLGHLIPSELVVISTGGKKVSGKLAQSTEYKLHLGIYKYRPDISAVCHAHPIYSTAFAVAEKSLDKLILPEIISNLGIIPLVEYGTPGTSEVFEKMKAMVLYHDAFLLKNHGVVTLGRNIEDAFNKMEMVERFARIMFISKMLGKQSALSKKQIEKIPGSRKIQLQLKNRSNNKKRR